MLLRTSSPATTVLSERALHHREELKLRSRRPRGVTILDWIARSIQVDPETGCHVWKRGTNRGYGRMRGEGGASVYVHRVVFESANGTCGNFLAGRLAD